MLQMYLLLYYTYKLHLYFYISLWAWKLRMEVVRVNISTFVNETAGSIIWMLWINYMWFDTVAKRLICFAQNFVNVEEVVLKMIW